MRFRIGAPPEDDTISRQDGDWNTVKEPGHLGLQMMGVFVAVFIGLSIAVVLSLSVGVQHVLDLSWPMVILFIFLILPIHDLVHAAGFKGGVMSRQVVFGFYPKVLGCYAHYDGQIPRNRYVIIAALPFLVLTAVPLALVAGLRLDYEYLTELIIANGLASSLDVLTVAIILKETPQRSVLMNSGMRTYWRLPANKAVRRWRAAA